MTQQSYRRGSVFGLRLPGFDLLQGVRNTGWDTEASQEEVASDLLGPLIQPEEVVQTFSADSDEVASGGGGTKIDTVTHPFCARKETAVQRVQAAAAPQRNRHPPTLR